jgi:hypothetical protein
LEDHGSGAGRGTGRGSGLGASRILMRWRVDLEADRRRKCHRRVRARVMLSGGDIFTGDLSLPDKSIDGWIKANGAAKRRRRRAECAALTEHVIFSDCEISRVGSTSSDDQSGRRHKMIGGLWWQQWRKRGTT